MVSWKAFKNGTVRIWSHKKLVLWLYLINVLFAAVLVLPFRKLVSKISRTDLSEDFVRGFHLNSFLDFWAKHSTEFKSLGLAAFVLGLLYLLFNVYLTGGIVATLASDSRITLRRFSTGAGRFFWRYVRLLLIFLVVFGGILAANSEWLEPYVSDQEKTVTTDRASFLWSVGNQAAIFLAAAFALMVFDYAKIRTVIQRRRSMVVAVLSALGFVLRRPIRTVSLFAMNLLILVLLFASYLLAENLLSNATYASMFTLLIVQQLLILGRIWMKLSFFASQIKLYEDALAPAAHQPTAPPIISVPVPAPPVGDVTS